MIHCLTLATYVFTVCNSKMAPTVRSCSNFGLSSTFLWTLAHTVALVSYCWFKWKYYFKYVFNKKIRIVCFCMLTFIDICISPSPFGLHCLTMHATNGRMLVHLQLANWVAFAIFPSFSSPAQNNFFSKMAFVS